MALLNFCAYKRYLNILFSTSNFRHNSSCLFLCQRLTRFFKSYVFNSGNNSFKMTNLKALKFRKLNNKNRSTVFPNASNELLCKHGSTTGNCRFFHSGCSLLYRKTDKNRSDSDNSLVTKSNRILDNIENADKTIIPNDSKNDWISQNFFSSLGAINEYSYNLKEWTKSQFQKTTDKTGSESDFNKHSVEIEKIENISKISSPLENIVNDNNRENVDEIPGPVRAYFSDKNLKELNLLYEEKVNTVPFKNFKNIPSQPSSDDGKIGLLTKQLENLRLWFPTLNVRQQTTNVLKKETNDKKIKEKDVNRKIITRTKTINRKDLEHRTKGIATNVIYCTTTSSLKTRLDQLCEHLHEFPQAKNIANKDCLKNNLLWRREINLDHQDPELLPRLTKALNLLGHVDPVSHRGIRVLSLDGGGTRGLLSITMLRKLETICNAPIHELFDYVCGVSTGGLIAALLSAYKLSLDEIEEIYRKFSLEMFQRNRLRGTGNLLFQHSYYDTNLWEDILKNQVGMKTFLEIASDPSCPKLAILSTIMNQPQMTNFVFRNYCFPPGIYSHYVGSIHHQVWEGIRASSAAPGYYAEFKLGDYIHSDGGILTNNPTAVALHEAKLLWPNEAIQCIVSLGTGRFRPIDVKYQTSPSLSNKVYKIVQSATDTEAVHTIMSDLSPRSSYFRFNPYMSDDFQLDEIRPEKWKSMEEDTVMYCRKNEYKFKKVGEKLKEKRLMHQIIRDSYSLNSVIKKH